MRFHTGVRGKCSACNMYPLCLTSYKSSLLLKLCEAFLSSFQAQVFASEKKRLDKKRAEITQCGVIVC